MIVVVDEGFDLSFKITGQEVVFQQDAVLQCLMPALDLALGLRMIWRTARVLHAFVLQPFGQLARDIAGSVVAQQSWFVEHMNLITAGRLKGQIQRVSYVLGPYVFAEFPRDDVPAVIVQDRAEIEPSPTNDLEIGEVGLPKLGDARCLVFELTGRLDHNEGWAGDQVMRLQYPIHCGFRDKIAFLIRERHRQLTRRQFRLLQRQFDDISLYLGWDTVPDVLWRRRSILQPSLTALQIPIIPAIERRARNTQLGQCQAG